MKGIELIELVIELVKENKRSIIAWGTVFLFFFLSFWANWIISLAHAILVVTFLLITTYIEKKYIVKYLQRGNNFLFYFINILLVIVMSVLTIYLESFMLTIMSKHISLAEMRQPDGAKAFFIPLLIRILIYIITIAISVITDMQRAEKESQRIKNEIKSEKLDMELRFLKSQMTPHFLFNALNNIYSLVYIKDEKAPQSVLKLSDMLRYVMVDCQVDLISLEKEVKYIDAYIDFHMMSMENNSNIIFDKKIKNPNFKIPPMILQPLVENSFKHSRLDNDPNGYVHFYIIQENNNLIFIARNSMNYMSSSLVDPNKKKQAGIGLANVKKRLELYYGNNYSFNVKQEDNSYVVTIKIGDVFNEKEV
jgi:sensor histidine kinase YesM